VTKYLRMMDKRKMLAFTDLDLTQLRRRTTEYMNAVQSLFSHVSWSHPKFHALSHFADYMAKYGSCRNFDTQMSEGIHTMDTKPHGKRIRSTQGNLVRSMGDWQNRQEGTSELRATCEMKGVGKKRERDPDGLRNVLQGVIYKSLRSDVLLNVLKGMDGTLGMEYIEDKLRTYLREEEVDMKDMKYSVYRTAEVYRGVDDEGGNAEVVQFVRATESFRGEERRDFCVVKGNARKGRWAGRETEWHAKALVFLTASGYQKGNFEKRVTFDMVYVRWLRKVSDEWFNKLGEDKQEVMKHFKGATFTFMTGEEAYDVITTQALEKRAPLENVNKDGQGVFVNNEYVEM